MKNSDNSRFNIVSSIVSLTLALEALNAGEDSIGIITPYGAQTRLIQALLQDADPERKWKDNISCATVHQFQGSERNLIIFDAVESFPAARAGLDNYNVLIESAKVSAEKQVRQLALSATINTPQINVVFKED